MAEAVGSAFFPPAKLITGQVQKPGKPIKENAAEVRGVSYRSEKFASNYFDTDFLNMRSIFSLVASQQAWLAWAACRAWLAALWALSADDLAD